MPISYVPLATELGRVRDPKADQAARTAALAQALSGGKGERSGALPYSKGATAALAMKGLIDGLGARLAADAEEERRAKLEGAGTAAMQKVLGGLEGTSAAAVLSSAPAPAFGPSTGGSSTGAKTKFSAFNPKSIPSFVATAGEPHGISGDYLNRVAWIESRGDPKAVSPTGAKGIFQFIGSTAKRYGLTDPFDPAASAAAAARLAADNRAHLRSILGRDPSDAETYLAHQQGADGAAALLANPNAPAADALARAYGGNRAKAARAISVNGGDPDAPASAFAGKWIKRYEALGQRQAMAMPDEAQGTAPAAPAQVASLPPAATNRQALERAAATVNGQPAFDNAPIAMLPNSDSFGPMVPVPPERPSDVAESPAQDWRTAQATPEQFDAQLGAAAGQSAGLGDIIGSIASAIGGGGGGGYTPEIGFQIPMPTAPAGPPMPPKMQPLDPAAPSGAILKPKPEPSPYDTLNPAPAAAPLSPVAPGASLAPSALSADAFPPPVVPDTGISPVGPGQPVLPSRRALLAQALADAPLPPPRPDFADIPSPGAREAIGRQPVPTQTQMIAQVLARPNNGIPTDDPDSAGAFARSGMGGGPDIIQLLGAALSGKPMPTVADMAAAPGMGRNAPLMPGPGTMQPHGQSFAAPGSPAATGYDRPTPMPGGGGMPPQTQMIAGPGSPAGQPQGAPLSILPPGAGGGPVPGPNGPVAAPGARSGLPFDAATITALANSPNPAHRAVANAVVQRMFAGPETAEVGGALVDKRTGNVIYRAPGRATWGVVSEDAYGNKVHGWIDPASQQVTPYQPQGGAGGQVLPGQPGSVIPAPPPGVDPKAWREAHSKQAAADALPVDPARVTSLRKEVLDLPSYKNIAQAAPIYRSMAETAGRNSRASDLNLVYGLGKIMDPGSVVREGEMVMVRNTASLPDWLVGSINALNGGQALTPQTRQAIMQEAHSRMKSYEDQFDFDAQHYSGIAKRGRMNVEDVLPQFPRSQPWQLPPEPTAGGAGTLRPGDAREVKPGVMIRRVN